MAENTFGLLLWVWLLGAPLVGAFIELGRTRSSARSRYDAPRGEAASAPIR